MGWGINWFFCSTRDSGLSPIGFMMVFKMLDISAELTTCIRDEFSGHLSKKLMSCIRLFYVLEFRDGLGHGTNLEIEHWMSYAQVTDMGIYGKTLHDAVSFYCERLCSSGFQSRSKSSRV